VDRINLTIYFRSSFVVETYNKKFYIMDIGECLKNDKMGLIEFCHSSEYETMLLKSFSPLLSEA